MRLRSIIVAILLLTCLESQAQFLYPIPKAKPLYCPSDTVSVYIIGDVMMHTRQLQHDHTYFLSQIEPYMQQADFCIANMEFSLGGEPYSGYPAFSTPDYYADYVASCGADVFLTANNHILDRGSRGLLRTIRIYDGMAGSHGIRYTGIGKEPLIIHKHGIRIALVNFTYGTNVGPDGKAPDVLRMKKEDVSTAIQSGKSAGADFIVALPHWGVEYELQHCARQEEWARWLAEQGCSAIVGAHPHVVQDTTHIKGVPVIYSMGNAVSNMSAPNTRLELAVTLRFVIDHISGEKKMLEPQLDWLWCTLPGKLTPSYATVRIKDWATRRSEWLNPSDYDNMCATLARVQAATGIR